MAFTARLQFGDNNAKRYGSLEYLISDFQYHTLREHNGLRPDSDAACERLQFTVIVPEKGDLSLYEWYVSGDARSGRILIELSSEKMGEDNVCREVAFNDAVCFALSEHYSIAASRPRELTLGLMTSCVTSSDVDGGNPRGGGFMAPAVKGILVNADLSTSKTSLTAYNNVPLQEFHYSCSRVRDRHGFPHGPSQNACLNFVLKVSSSATSKTFYDNLVLNEPSVFSFLFDNTFVGKKELTDFENALIVRGYVVDIEESFDKNPTEREGSFNMMMLKVELLLAEIRYIGGASSSTSSSLPLTITND